MSATGNIIRGRGGSFLVEAWDRTLDEQLPLVRTLITATIDLGDMYPGDISSLPLTDAVTGDAHPVDLGGGGYRYNIDEPQSDNYVVQLRWTISGADNVLRPLQGLAYPDEQDVRKLFGSEQGARKMARAAQGMAGEGTVNNASGLLTNALVDVEFDFGITYPIFGFFSVGYQKQLLFWDAATSGFNGLSGKIIGYQQVNVPPIVGRFQLQPMAATPQVGDRVIVL